MPLWKRMLIYVKEKQFIFEYLELDLLFLRMSMLTYVCLCGKYLCKNKVKACVLPWLVLRLLEGFKLGSVWYNVICSLFNSSIPTHHCLGGIPGGDVQKVKEFLHVALIENTMLWADYLNCSLLHIVRKYDFSVQQ